jgi:hypothetical protein
MRIRRISYASSITKATDTQSEYVICIPFPRQQWLLERASVLGYGSTYNICLVTDITAVRSFRKHGGFRSFRQSHRVGS